MSDFPGRDTRWHPPESRAERYAEHLNEAVHTAGQHAQGIQGRPPQGVAHQIGELGAAVASHSQALQQLSAALSSALVEPCGPWLSEGNATQTSRHAEQPECELASVIGGNAAMVREQTALVLDLIARLDL